MKKLLMTLLLTFCIGCTYTLLNETNMNVSAKSTKETIMIDAGHGGYDVGSISNFDDYEKDINLDIALLVGKQLKSYGYNVVYTRTSDSVSWPSDNKKDLQARCNLAQKKNADLFISIHLNSSEYDASGYEIYCDFTNKTTVKLSNSILTQLDQLDYSTNRGLLDTNETPLYVVANNKVDAILIEAGFISDDSDLYYLKNYTNNIAKAIAKGIKKSLN
ncbi:N-acetylmuramoyl-L-alanine amidase [uncultured Holdemanella sp.]|uniref:N-acetylmuramoyl-L-alanine amidase n=1 Tax=uncultured Holdemanella sp. TaxID=1763549 RepID=UPI0025EFB100|nr:N-acetylmuramoyl-L-alanine amidase [uncultured Holdemanella sp.]